MANVVSMFDLSRGLYSIYLDSRLTAPLGVFAGKYSREKNLVFASSLSVTLSISDLYVGK